MSADSAESSFIATGVKWIMVVNLCQKVMTFAMNQILLQWTTPEVLGQASIQFELLLSTLLFLSREGVRLAVLREKVKTDQDMQAIINLSWLPFFVMCVVLSVAVFAVYVNDWNVGQYSLPSLFYCLGALFECLGEPWFNVFQNAMELSARLRAETMAVFLKSVVTFYIVGYLSLGVVGFGVAQSVYGLVYLIGLLSFIDQTGVRKVNGERLRFIEFFPRFIPAPNENISFSLFGSSALAVAKTMSVSSAVKHLLTEADKIVLSITASHFDQGVYVVTNNYGSLVARLVFLPLEDASRMAFSKLAAETRAAAATASASDGGQATLLSQCLLSLKNHFVQLMRLVGFLGAIFPVFGFAYSELVVELLLSPKWRCAETVRALSFYCLYIFVLGANGISEAFVQSIAPPSSLGRLSAGMLISTAVFVVCAIPFVSWFGTSGVVLANSISMAVRVLCNLEYVHRAFSKESIIFTPDRKGKPQLLLANVSSPLLQLMPSSLCVLTMAVSGVVVNCSAARYAQSPHALSDGLQHIGVGAVTGVAYLAVLLLLVCPREDVLRVARLVWREKSSLKTQQYKRSEKNE